MNRWLSWVLLALIVCLGLLLRWHDLGTESYWLDEGISLQSTHLTLPELVKERARNHHPPLYFLLLHWWVARFGDSEAATRSLSLIFGALAPLALFFLGRRLFDEPTALLAALLLALSRFHLHYSQETRSYSLVVLLYLASQYWFWRALREEGWRTKAGYVAATVFLLYTHYIGWYLVLIHNISWALLARRSEAGVKLTARRWLALQGLVFLLVAPWAFSAARSFLSLQKGWWVPEPTAENVWRAVTNFAGSPGLFGLFAPLTVLALLPGWPALRGFLRAPARRDSLILVALWALLPLAVPLLMAAVSASFFVDRYSIGALPAILLLVAAGLRRVKFKLVGAALVATVMVLSWSTLRTYYRDVTREQWREAADLVQSRARAGDLVILYKGFTQPVFAHYLRRTDLEVQPFWPPSLSAGATSVPGLDPLLAGHPRVWLVLAYQDGTGALIVEELARRYRHGAPARFRGVEVIRYRPRRGDGVSQPPPAPGR